MITKILFLEGSESEFNGRRSSSSSSSYLTGMINIYLKLLYSGQLIFVLLNLSQNNVCIKVSIFLESPTIQKFTSNYKYV